MPEAASTAAAAAWQPDDAAIAALVAARHGDPFAILGMHAGPARRLRCASSGRAPTASRCSTPRPASASPSWNSCIPTVSSPARFRGRRNPFPYRLRFSDGDVTWEAEDPYRFPPVLGEIDVHLIARGQPSPLYRAARRASRDARRRRRRRLRACGRRTPGASASSAISTMWDGRRHPMRKRFEVGIWELFIPGVAARRASTSTSWSAPNGQLLPLKADPSASSRSIRPPPPRASSACRATNGATPTGWSPAASARRSARRCRSTRCISARGGAGTATASSATTSSPTSSSPTRRTWASPISSACRSPSIPSTAHGAISRSASSRRPAASARPPTFARFVDRCHQAGSA